MDRHGRRATYVDHGCRCCACREANNAYHRQYRLRGPLPRAPRPRRRAATLTVECWCGARNVRVPVEDVRAGRTRSCGRADCCQPS